MDALTIAFAQLLFIALVLIVLYQLKSKITLVPLYIFIGSNQYSQHFLTNTLAIGGYKFATGSVIVFCSSIFAVLLIYIKEGVPKTRILILGIVLANFSLTAFAALTNLQYLNVGTFGIAQPFATSPFQITYSLFVAGTILLVIDSFLIVMVYEFLVRKITFLKRFGGIIAALLFVLYFDSVFFSLALSLRGASFQNVLISQLIGKTVAGIIFGSILYLFLLYSDRRSTNFTDEGVFGHYDIYSILTYREKFLGLTGDETKFESELTKHLVNTLETMSDGFTSIDSNWRYTYINRVAAAAVQKRPENLIGRELWAEFPGLVGTLFYENCHLVASTGQPIEFENYADEFGKWFYARIAPLNNGLSIFSRDITESKEHEITIEAALKRNEALLTALPDLMFVIDKNGIYTDFHNPHNRYTIAPPDKYVGSSIYDILTSELAAESMENVERALTSGQILLQNYQMEYPDGERYFEARYAKNNDSEVLTVVRDITYEKNVENSLIESEARYRNLIEQASDGILVHDMQGNIVDFNEATIRYTGYGRDELKDMTILDALFPEDLVDLPIPFDRLLAGETTGTRRRIKKKDGSEIFMDISSRMNHEGNVIAIARDVTERLAVENEVAESESRFRTLTQNVPIGIFQTDIDGECTFVNDRWVSISGISFEDALGDGWSKAIHPDDRDRVFESWNSAVAENRWFSSEYRFQNRNGKVTLVEGKAIGLHDQKGGKYGFIGTINDVTEKRQTEAELKIYREKLEQLVEERTSELEIEKIKAQAADRLKSAFLATMSHELRTPLNSIIGFTGILLNEFAGPLNEEQVKQLGMVRNSARHLLSLINDILDLSKIEAGELSFSMECYDFTASVEKVVGLLKPIADSKNLTLEMTFSGQCIELISDERRVEQILMNLLDNALKFSENGGVTIDCEVVKDMLLTKITDTGIGIRKEDLSKLFVPFSQIESGLTRKHQGTGLGLSISQKIVKMLGGSLTVESEFGVGSTFTVKLPYKKS